MGGLNEGLEGGLEGGLGDECLVSDCETSN